MEQEDKNLQAQPSEAPEKPEKQPLPKGYEAYLSLFDLVRMLAVITLVFVFFFRLNGVSGSSMYPTLVDKDYLVLESNFLYRDAKQGDIVVLYTPPFSDNDELLVKRVIAVGGQTVDIDFDAGIVYVDGQALDEPYTFEPTRRSAIRSRCRRASCSSWAITATTRRTAGSPTSAASKRSLCWARSCLWSSPDGRRMNLEP